MNLFQHSAKEFSIHIHVILEAIQADIVNSNENKTDQLFT